MTNFDIFGVLRTYAASKGWVFLSGPLWSQNYEATVAELTANKYILTADFKIIPTIKNNLVGQIRYQGQIMLGSKKELTTESSLDETFIQKYDRRLLTLITDLSTAIGSIGCANELDFESINMAFLPNQFDENIDFVIADITMVQR